jgi:hypothetical protein
MHGCWTISNSTIRAVHDRPFLVDQPDEALTFPSFVSIKSFRTK